MVKRRQVVVIGLGRFGTAVATTLAAIGHEVLAVDINQRLVQEISDDVTHAVQADATDPEALAELGISGFDAGIVGVSADIDRSILITMQLKELGVPHVIAKAQTGLHGRILAKLGADRVILPEREVGEQVAHSFMVPGALDYLSVGPEYGVSKIMPPPAFIGRTVAELALHERYDVTLLMIERPSQVVLLPEPDERIRPDDLLVVAASDEAMERLGAHTGKR
jgi:trk system potassium uptake protein TrkA